MPWKKTANVAMFDGTDWNNLVKTVSDCTPELAQRIALKDPKISFFFFCKEGISLKDHGNFQPGDAVFFSGEPWYGSAPQCDSYQKDGISVAYVSLPELETVGDYSTADGGNAVDVVCIFASNINKKPFNGPHYILAPEVNVPDGYPYLIGAVDYDTLTAEAVGKLQDKGITVLLTALNNHDDTGWSEFTNPDTASSFADQLKAVVDRCGLDGIDIDDEYSNGTPQLDSLAMVTTIMREKMPDIIISKALFSDSQYFGPSYGGRTLADNLTYGWEMSYGEAPNYRLPQYLNLGMTKDSLVCGFWSGGPSPSPASDVDWLKSNGYAGVMVYAFQEQANVNLLGDLVNDWDGPGNWNKTS